MLEELAEFVEMLQCEDRNQIQLQALVVRLFFSDYLEEGEDFDSIGLGEQYFDLWVDFLSAVVDMPVDAKIELPDTIQFCRLFGKFHVHHQYNPNSEIKLWGADGKTIKIGIPYGAISFFEIIRGCSTEVLLRCPNCHKIFVNTTKRHMKFCSKQCRTHFSVKKLRRQEAVNKLIGKMQSIPGS